VMDAALFRVPDIVEGAAKLRALGLTAMKAGDVSPEQMRVLNDVAPIAEFQVNNMRDGLAKAVAYNASVGAPLAAGTALDASASFFTLARKSVVNGKDFSPETQTAYLASANAAIEAQYVFAAKALDALDALIVTRIAGMQSQRNTLTGVLVTGLVLATYAFYSFFLVTRQGLNVISKHLGEISLGDLRTPPGKPQGSDEFAKAILDVQIAYDALHALIRKVRHGARSLHASSDEIAHASANLQARTEAAAASLEQQASAMEEIGSTVGATSERVGKAASFALDNMRVAERGGQVFAAVTTTMQEIQTSSRKISDIISVIDGIAFQTNILALNAAVEAARAGESGRGFAVVASEVRNLAGRCAAAAREIKTLISTSVEKIEHGTALVGAADETMGEVVVNATKINDYLGEIASAAREQATGVAEVGRSIQVLDKNTQENAALVEETTSAADALRQQATTLQEEIANFRVA
jgi:methyl-accepting chemotaxis protein